MIARVAKEEIELHPKSALVGNNRIGSSTASFAMLVQNDMSSSVSCCMFWAITFAAIRQMF